MKFNRKIIFFGVFLGVTVVSALLFVAWRFSQKPTGETAAVKAVAGESQGIAGQGDSSDASVSANIDPLQKSDNSNFPQELIEKRTESSKTSFLGYREDGRARYSLDSSIGAIHYKDDYDNPNEQWKDIDLTWEGNKITKAPYELTREGDKITVRDKKTGNVSTIELLDVKPGGLKKEIVPENTRVSFRHTLPSDNIPFESKFRITGNIPLIARAFDDEGEISLETTLKDGILTEKLTGGVKDKQTGQARPVKGEIRIDPTLDLQVGANGDDGIVYGTSQGSGGTFGNGGWIGLLLFGKGSSNLYNNWTRFTGITIISGATITVAYLTYTGGSSLPGTGNTVYSDIWANDTGTPVAPTTASEYWALVKTTATAAWDSIANWSTGTQYNTPSLVALVQELVDSYSYSNAAMQFMHWDGGSSADAYRGPYDYSGSAAGATKLHIEYSPPTVNIQGVDLQGINID